MKSGEAIDQQREYARVETRMAVRVRRATQDEVDGFAERVVGADIGEDDLPIALVAYLRNVEYKLDLILARLDPRYEAPLDPADLRPVTISAGGLCTGMGDLDLEHGESVHVDMLLPGDAQRAIHALGRVTRATKADSGPGALAVEYTAIDEGDRDAIVRLVNRLQLAAGRRPKAAP